MDGKPISINLTAYAEFDRNSKDVSMRQESGVKLELCNKDELGTKDDGVGSSQTEMGLRADLRSLKYALQTMERRARWLIEGKRKREEEED